MTLLAGLVRRFRVLVRNLFRRRREDDETAEELRFHLEMEAEKNLRAGMAPGEAHRRARLRLGGIDAIRDAVQIARGGRPLEDLARDIGVLLLIAGVAAAYVGPARRIVRLNLPQALHVE